MLALTLKEVAEITGGRLAAADPDAIARSVSIDSRRAGPGALFVALPGERADGHDFAADARERGAVGALVSREVAGIPCVVVGDSAGALARLAAAVRLRLGARVVAITGSSGKTCTKDFTAAALGGRYRVTASEASFNNEIGVPLTVLAADERTEVVVAEVGSRGVGHIAALMPILRPEVSVVVNVGPAHVGIFGSIDAIVRAKGELVEALTPEGTAVLNADDPRVLAMRERSQGRVVTFGTSHDADVRATDLALDDLAHATFVAEAAGQRVEISLPLPGEHMVSNALAALAVATRLGVPLGDAAAGVARCAPSRWRMQVFDTPGGWRVVNDAYNANPASTEAALKALVRMGRGRRTWAVLGQMAELGEVTAVEHDRIGRLAVRLGVGRLVTVGEDARPLHEAARLEGMTPEEATLVRDVDAAITLLERELRAGDVVLVKASRVAGLERVADQLSGTR